MPRYKPVDREDAGPVTHDKPAPRKAAKYVSVARDETPAEKTTPRPRKRAAKKSAPPPETTTEVTEPAQPAENEESA